MPDFRAGLDLGVRGLRVGVVRHFFETDNAVSAATRKGIDDALAWLTAEVATVREVTLSPLSVYSACTFVIRLAEAYAIHEPWLKTERASNGEFCRDGASLGGLIRVVDYVQAQRRRRELCEEARSAMADGEVVNDFAKGDHAGMGECKA